MKSKDMTLGDSDTSYAFAIAIRLDEVRVLYAKRNASKVKDYRGWWSLPSMSVSRLEYESALKTALLPETARKEFLSRILPGIHFQNVELAISGMRCRGGNLLSMAVFTAQTTDLPPSSTEKYELFRYFTPEEFLDSTHGLCGTCVSLYFESLWRLRSIPSALKYLELVPEIADSNRNLDSYDYQELWELAAGNYSLLLRDKTGGDGITIRSLTLEKFLDAFI